MNILFIRSSNPFYESSADANRFSGLLKGLMDKGAKVTILVTRGYNNWREFIQRGIPQGFNNLNVIYTCTVFNNNIWYRRINSIILAKPIAVINAKYLRNYLKQNYDYIWLTKETSILKGFLENYNSISAKTMMELNEFHDIYKGAGAIGNSLQQKQADTTNDVFCKAVAKIDCFAIMTKTLINHYKMMAKPEARFCHIQMTVDLQRFRHVVSSDLYKKPYIAYTGTFNNAKDGVDVLIQSFGKIAAKFPKHHLYLAGFWHYDVPMQEKLIKELGLVDRVTYLGVLDKDKVPAFVCNADLLVLSRPDSHQAQGGFPTKLGEYLATGNPVCVTKVGEIPNYLIDNVSAFMAEPGNIDSFADAMERALGNPIKAKEVAQKGKEVAETEFNLQTQSEKLFMFLQDDIKQ